MTYFKLFQSPLREAEEGARRNPRPIVVHNPITDDVMIRDEAIVAECANPAFSSNGGE